MGLSYEFLDDDEFKALVTRIISTAAARVSTVDAVAAMAQALGLLIGTQAKLGHVPGLSMEDILALAHKTVDDFARDTMAKLLSDRP